MDAATAAAASGDDNRWSGASRIALESQSLPFTTKPLSFLLAPPSSPLYETRAAITTKARWIHAPRGNRRHRRKNYTLEERGAGREKQTNKRAQQKKKKKKNERFRALIARFPPSEQPEAQQRSRSSSCTKKSAGTSMHRRCCVALFTPSIVYSLPRSALCVHGAYICMQARRNYVESDKATHLVGTRCVVRHTTRIVIR